MKLSELLAGVPLREALTPELADLEVAGLDYDSRRVEKGFVFFAFAGSRVDGRQFAQDALARGALAIVSESPQPAEFRGRLDTSRTRPPRAGHRREQFLPAP